MNLDYTGINRQKLAQSDRKTSFPTAYAEYKRKEVSLGILWNQAFIKEK